MERTRATTLVAVASVSTAVCLIALRLWEMRGGAPVRVPLLLAVVLVLVAGVVLALGWRVRRFTLGRADLEPIVAARILALAKACAVVGALQVGYLLAQLLLVVGHVEAPEPRAQAWACGLGLLGAGTLVAASLIAEWWCRVPKDDDRDDDPDDSGPEDDIGVHPW
ncbi:putative integral membrane protein [Beutenbergia cavernae DSM 12333]|uniref:Putative integral membrane protein n=1 Tax=Beutenbergia cavernae (strain ATCC BAA-8 / DSM 12333 / CCUG 43141 / JCM 11478 / NBRC 16432 / NCIMB 13614 / HKI 0122) TaxID=471853 RepID=C5BYK9_BEUC1|nr:DUF3180 domain-containing protein [Beutenbergia cavernae]ACQ78967.1 putative integral membrane protein [Beutenbergia cavernae DSM 12333]